MAEVSESIFNRKNICYRQLAQKLNETRCRSKTYWLILKSFYKSKKSTLDSTIVEQTRTIFQVKS